MKAAFFIFGKLKPIPMQKYALTVLISLMLLVLNSCDVSNKREIPTIPQVDVSYPEWVKSASIYEVNIRQFTPEGTFKAFIPHITRLKELGVDVLWLMPIHPIGMVNRKGSLGSYYAVQDYKLVNPEFGSAEDLHLLVDEAHRQGMYVILDWVANHTAWDNVYRERNPEYYTRNEKGEIIPPVADWTDVADLNYEVADLREAMKAAMGFYVQEYKIDGFRCDVAGMVPLDFWQELRASLSNQKRLFMLAEDEKPELFQSAFDMDYGWEMHRLFNQVAKGEASAIEIRNLVNHQLSTYPTYAIKMNFTSNHDENSWNGTEYERLGDAVECFAALTFMLPGMPLIYSGQEAGLDRRLSFFDKDKIEWKEHSMKDVYTTLLRLKKENQALWNGQDGGSISIIQTNEDARVLAFSRDKAENTLISFFNMSNEAVEFTMNTDGFRGKYKNVFTGETIKIKKEFKQSLPAWGYIVIKKM